MTSEGRLRVDRFMSELEATFVSELGERIVAMERAILELEGTSGAAAVERTVRELSRHAHTLKGGAQILGLKPLADVTHALESYLARRSGDEPVDVELLLSAIDVLRSLAATPAADVASARELIDRLGPGSPAAPTRAPAAVTKRPTRQKTSRKPVQADMDVASRPTLPRGSRLDSPASLTVSPERIDAVMRATVDVRATVSEAATRWRELGERGRELQELGGALSALRREHSGESGRQLPAAVAAFERSSDELADSIARLAILLRQGAKVDRALEHAIGTLETDVANLRMIPVERVFRQFPRMVRDSATRSGKEVSFEAIGWETPMDRELLGRIQVPLMHLLRNAVDHGIEPPDERLAAGKPRAGLVRVVVSPRVGGIWIEVQDDGRGMDVARIRSRAIELGRLDAARLPDSALLDLIFEPGFSTAVAVTETSGRGVGLDVVRSQVTSCGGRVELESSNGTGTRFELRLPLTLLSTRVLIIRLHGERYGIPVASVERVIRDSDVPVRRLGAQEVLELDGDDVPVCPLARILAVADRDDRPGVAVVIASPASRVGVLVDAVEAERDVVVGGLAPVLGPVQLLAGTAVEGEEVLLVLDGPAIAERGLAVAHIASGASSTSLAARPDGAGRHVLVVDDSVTTRTLERDILVSAGFKVSVATDGLDALRQLREDPPHVVLADVDMPRMDGLEMLRRVRADDRLRDIPVILLTSMETPEHRELGFAAGADAYLFKSAFDQEQLLAAIRELID